MLFSVLLLRMSNRGVKSVGLFVEVLVAHDALLSIDNNVEYKHVGWYNNEGQEEKKSKCFDVDLSVQTASAFHVSLAALERILVVKANGAKIVEVLANHPRNRHDQRKAQGYQMEVWLQLPRRPLVQGGHDVVEAQRHIVHGHSIPRRQEEALSRARVYVANGPVNIFCTCWDCRSTERVCRTLQPVH